MKRPLALGLLMASQFASTATVALAQPAAPPPAPRPPGGVIAPAPAGQRPPAPGTTPAANGNGAKPATPAPPGAPAPLPPRPAPGLPPSVPGQVSAPGAPRPPGPPPLPYPVPARPPGPLGAPTPPRPGYPMLVPTRPPLLPLPPLSSYSALAPDDLTSDALDLPPDPVELAERLQRTEDLVLNRQPSVIWGGYIDFGFFAAGGNGAGYIQDFGHARKPEYANRYGWVFLGDILAPTINSRGEAADLGDAPGVDRFDSVHSRGAPGFILSEANLALTSALTPRALVSLSVNVMPRTGNEFRLGDFLELDLAQVEWLPTESQQTSLFAGKIDSVLGVEYRDRKANRRFGITPSLIARYTVGTALGLKIRSKFGEGEWLVLAAAVTNGSNVAEQFHFYNEVDSNAGKTVSGRLSLRPFGLLELGVSGSWGAQDRSLASDKALWFAGVDMLAELGPVALKAQWLKGKGAGNPLEGVYQLDLKGGGYLELDLGLGPLGLIARGEFRDALVILGDERLYLTKSWRATAGVRWSLTARSVIKAEFLRNGEYGGLPGIRNDVFTSSLVLSY